MFCVSRELGEHIAIQRKRSRLTQQQLADILTNETDRPISMHMVSAWERGLRDLPAAMLPALCRVLHCSSFDLYPHSGVITDRELQLIATIKAMSDDEKDDLYYLLHDWLGDRRALIKLDVIHAVQSAAMRREPDMLIINNYIYAVKHNDPDLDRRISTDLAYVQKAARELLDDKE